MKVNYTNLVLLFHKTKANIDFPMLIFLCFPWHMRLLSTIMNKLFACFYYLSLQTVFLAFVCLDFKIQSFLKIKPFTLFWFRLPIPRFTFICSKFDPFQWRITLEKETMYVLHHWLKPIFGFLFHQISNANTYKLHKYFKNKY